MRWRLQHRQRWSRVQYDFSCPFISAHRTSISVVGHVLHNA
eukprot:COSAG04_NODE_8047_length_1030_cov_1.607948_2_plen_40_part_01